MNTLYNETICKLCPFNDNKEGTVSKSIQLGKFGSIKYINCLRDNEDAKERLNRTLKDENGLRFQQTINFEKCLFDPENISSFGK
jgi:hypothetical protein